MAPDFGRAKILDRILCGTQQVKGVSAFSSRMTSSGLLYLHEHAKSSFKEISEARGHMFDINRIWPFGIKYFLHDLLQQRPVGCLERQNIVP